MHSLSPQCALEVGTLVIAFLTGWITRHIGAKPK